MAFSTSQYFSVLKSIVLSGGLVLKALQGKVENQPKSSDLPVTEIEETSTAHSFVDDLVQEIALEILGSHMPNIAINVEEKTPRQAKFTQSDHEICFHLDPLDGTFAYLQGREDYSIGAAISQNLTFIVSAIYFPAFDRFYYAERNKGVTLMSSMGKPFSFERLNSPKDFYCQKRSEDLLDVVHRMGLQTLDCLSAHHKMIAVAEGKAQVQLCRLASPHDFGIPQVILEEVGGVCTDLSGNAIHYSPTFPRVPYFLAFYDHDTKDRFFDLYRSI